MELLSSCRLEKGCLDEPVINAGFRTHFNYVVVGLRLFNANIRAALELSCTNISLEQSQTNLFASILSPLGRKLIVSNLFLFLLLFYERHYHKSTRAVSAALPAMRGTKNTYVKYVCSFVGVVSTSVEIL